MIFKRRDNCFTLSRWLCDGTRSAIMFFSKKHSCKGRNTLLTYFRFAWFSAPPPPSVNYRNRLPPALGGRIWFLTKFLLRDYVGFDLSSDTAFWCFSKLTIPPVISNNIGVSQLFVLLGNAMCSIFNIYLFFFLFCRNSWVLLASQKASLKSPASVRKKRSNICLSAHFYVQNTSREIAEIDRGQQRSQRMQN